MKIPVGICIKQNKVFVTQYDSHCLNLYNTNLQKGSFLILWSERQERITVL